MKIEGTSITMIRGDTETILVFLENMAGEPVPLEDSDTIYFTVKTTTETESKILQKVVDEFIDGKAVVKIKPADTRHLKIRSYVYDIQLTRGYGAIKTIVEPSPFILKGDVTYE